MRFDVCYRTCDRKLNETRSKDMRKLSIVFCFLAGCGGGGGDSAVPAATVPVAPSTVLSITVENNTDKTIFGVDHVTPDGVDMLQFPSNILPGYAGTINIDVTAICNYDVDGGMSQLWLVYNYGGGNIYHDPSTAENMLYNCPLQVDFTCAADFALPTSTADYRLTCVGGLN